jgi:hypothetical protein
MARESDHRLAASVKSPFPPARSVEIDIEIDISLLPRLGLQMNAGISS